jgi:hypothetical protein
MSYRVHLTKLSHNKKTGPIPVSTTDKSTCPPSCGYFEECYAKFGNLRYHWNTVNTGERGVTWDEFCDEISRLPKNQLWRHNQAGDLPGDGVSIDPIALDQLILANKGRRGFTYSHYPLTPHNLQKIERSGQEGFTINLSCDSLAISDSLIGKTTAPKVVVLPSSETRKSFLSPAGEKIVVCPATYRDDVMCFNCGVCQDRSANRAVIGFPAHGTKKRVINIKLEKAA